MAMVKYAKATIVTPHVTGRHWKQVRQAGYSAGKVADPRRTKVAKKSNGKIPTNLVDQASSIFGDPFNPGQYLLTHATIVASVDVSAPQGTKVGHVLEDGFRVNRRFANYRITSNTQRFVNNNNDAWSREVLLKSFNTFVGGHNFVEHVQIEELSKGRIIDAVARDVGDSVYIDILIATDRKHGELVAAIESGEMSTLSMGCTVDGTICTKCGHWAADESEMCRHIKYEKGQTFYDEMGRAMRVAELCGHESIEPSGGVQFIEASWVETPAFTGAVMRNILEPSEEIARMAAEVLSQPPKKWQAGVEQRAASSDRTATSLEYMEQRVAGEIEPQLPIVVGTVRPSSVLTEPDMLRVGNPDDAFFAGWEDEVEDAEGGEEEAPAEEPEKSPLSETEDELHKHFLNKVKNKVKDDMKEQDTSDALETTAPDEGLQAGTRLYMASIKQIAKTSACDAEFIDRVASFNNDAGIQIPIPLYRAALLTGGTRKFGSVDQFLGVAQTNLGHPLSAAEARTLVRLGNLLSQHGVSQGRRERFNNPGSRHQGDQP